MRLIVSFRFQTVPFQVMKSKFYSSFHLPFNPTATKQSLLCEMLRAVDCEAMTDTQWDVLFRGSLLLWLELKHFSLIQHVWNSLALTFAPWWRAPKVQPNGWIQHLWPTLEKYYNQNKKCESFLPKALSQAAAQRWLSFRRRLWSLGFIRLLKSPSSFWSEHYGWKLPRGLCISSSTFSVRNGSSWKFHGPWHWHCPGIIQWLRS